MSRGFQQDSLLATPLNTSFVGSRVLMYEEVESTNDRALHLGGEGTVIIADRQTSGRGRHGRSWDSQAGLGLWFSVAFETPIDGLAFAAPLAVRDAVKPICACTVKWPNDVLAGGRKICGILVESRNNRTALGIGINVRHKPEDFPPELKDKATSIECLAGRDVDRGALLRDVLTELDRRIMVLRQGGLEAVRREWVEACAIMGRRVRCGDHVGVVKEITPEGGLVLETESGVRQLLLGEIVEMNGA
ncbi:MAG: biotin--[acetyl-CoA-carboxylase] ligase [Candidatus Hydrogenedentes bacterium]|nr:biotin--[acetyl-CoA-carboxylase] ligase [Candidatus Hydrogenedentota bacterium]